MARIEDIYHRIRSAALRLALSRLLPVKPRPDLIHLGSGYGGWIVPEQALRPGTLCYCVGAGTDITFDLSLARDFACDVHCFDPTPAAIAHVAEVAAAIRGFSFYPYGIWVEDTSMRFYEPIDPQHVSHSIKNLQGTDGYFTAPCRTVESLMEELGHDVPDLIKLDIEGAEYEVLGQLIARSVLPRVVCVEFDQPLRVSRFARLVRHLFRTHELVSIDKWNYTFVARDN